MSGPDTMTAAVVTRFGGPDALVVRDEAVPSPGPGEVQIAVAFAGVNFSEVYARRGQTPGFEPPFIPGLEVAGLVTAVGAGVDGPAVGTPVAALSRRGGYAQYVCCPAAQTFALASADAETLRQAAAVPTSVATAWIMLADAVRLREGATILVHAAAGALGLALASIARHLGAGRVLGTVGTAAKVAIALDHGYDEVYLRDRWLDDIHEHGHAGGVDIVVDSVGGQTFRDSRTVLDRWGHIVICGDAGWHGPEPIDRTDLWFSNTAVLGFNIGQLAAADPHRYHAGTVAALRALHDGAIRMPIAATWPLADVARVHAELEAATTTGKHVLQIG